MTIDKSAKGNEHAFIGERFRMANERPSSSATESPDRFFRVPLTLARIACSITGHWWPDAPGACESHVRWLHPLENYMRCGWGVCARCGAVWAVLREQ